ncbi:MAG: ribonuclease III [Deltaproteobacteria bacterium]|nr:ribonuclease III [Deltaproteobacteria bacterium]
MPVDSSQWAEFEAFIDYSFQNRSLLIQAMTHKSFAHEESRLQSKKSLRDNERLEFLGDAVLSLCISSLLMEQHAERGEGELSRRRAALVNASALAEIAKRLRIEHYIRLGRGEEESRGRSKNSILADAYEALLGAIFCDGGYEAAYAQVLRHFESILDSNANFEKLTSLHRDYKTELQEAVQSIGWPLPVYRTIAKEGPDHDRIFTVALTVGEKEGMIGRGKSKKVAEQEAARAALASWIGAHS